ncbi:MAG TPA: hypothetical protein VNX28_09875 [Gemmataceae bacterium]|jgi:hypothetical protein|nr:hypothetical protein [Gemmataceae bacterium]
MLVENRIDEGQRLLDQLTGKGIVVQAACWLKPVDQDRWSLAIATPTVDEKGALSAYGQVLPVLRSLGQGWITGSDIKLLGAKHRLVHDLVDLQKRFPDTPMLSLRELLGGIPVEEVYVYSPRKVKITIYGLVFRGEPSGSLHLSFEPHNPNTRLEVESTEYPAEIGIDWVVDAPEGATLVRDKAGMMELAWDFRGNRTCSSANEIWTLANLGLHGFRFLHEPTDRVLADPHVSRAKSMK